MNVIASELPPGRAPAPPPLLDGWERLVAVMAALGAEQVRLTGGEPLARRDLPELVRMLAATSGVRELSLTTNGVLLDRLAGPSSRPGCDASTSRWTRSRTPASPRSPAATRSTASWRGPPRPNATRSCCRSRSTASPFAASPSSRYPRSPPWRGASPLSCASSRLGFISPVSEPFCSSGDRIRLAAGGWLRTCLFSRREWDLRTALHDGADDDELEALIRRAIDHKELEQCINEPGFARASRTMSQIGGWNPERRSDQ